jgi:hypothetical protein
MHRWKHASPKKLSARKRGIFVDKKPSDSGLEPSKAGFCWLRNDVICSYRKSAKSGMTDRCLSCAELERFEREMDEEDEKMMDEIDEIRKYGYSSTDV